MIIYCVTRTTVLCHPPNPHLDRLHERAKVAERCGGGGGGGGSGRGDNAGAELAKILQRRGGCRGGRRRRDGPEEGIPGVGPAAPTAGVGRRRCQQAAAAGRGGQKTAACGDVGWWVDRFACRTESLVCHVCDMLLMQQMVQVSCVSGHRCREGGAGDRHLWAVEKGEGHWIGSWAESLGVMCVICF
jgi:hypothetical protein